MTPKEIRKRLALKPRDLVTAASRTGVEIEKTTRVTDKRAYETGETIDAARDVVVPFSDGDGHSEKRRPALSSRRF